MDLEKDTQRSGGGLGEGHSEVGRWTWRRTLGGLAVDLEKDTRKSDGGLGEGHSEVLVVVQLVVMQSD